MKQPAAPRGNFISEWFGQRIYPEVKLNFKAISGPNWGLCPFLSATKRAKTQCIKSENAFGVCTINSLGAEGRKDWLVCPYRVIDSDIVQTGCATIFDVSPSCLHRSPISILGDANGIAILEKTLDEHERAFVFFQDKLGGEISISATPSSPEVAFDITVVEISRQPAGTLKVGRYGFIEIQTMDFHGSYKAAVSNFSRWLSFARQGFPESLWRRTNRGLQKISKAPTSRMSLSEPSIRPF